MIFFFVNNNIIYILFRLFLILCKEDLFLYIGRGNFKISKFYFKKLVKFYCINVILYDIDLSKYKKWGNCLDVYLMVLLYLVIFKLLK